MRSCEVCSQSLEGRTPRARYCSDSCRNEHYKATGKRKETCSRYYQRRIKSDPQRYSRFLEMGRESYRRHPETAALYAKQWRGTNRERVRARNLIQQRERQPLTGHREDVREYAKIIHNDPCVYCGNASSVIDHIQPVARGGIHDPKNLAPACRSCNAQKRSKPLLQFLLTRRPPRQMSAQK